MGVVKLNDLIKKYAPNAVRIQPLTDFCNISMAIDGNNWCCEMMSVAHSNVVKRSNIDNGLPSSEEILIAWLELCLKSIGVILRSKIIPIFVFDGGVRPEKEALRERRRDKRLIEIEKANQIQIQIENAPLQRNDEAKEGLKNEAAKLWHLSYADLKVFRELLDVMGFPWFEAKYDAEQLCASLNSEGKVHAVHSSDVDSLVFGCLLLISSVKGPQAAKSKSVNGEYVKMVKVTRLPQVIENLEITQQQFIDMCILAGCDYNEQIKDIGIVVAYNMIKKYGSLDDIPINEDRLIDPYAHARLRKTTAHSIDDLNYPACRQIFSHMPSQELTKRGRLEFIRPTNLLKLKEYLSQYQVDFNLVNKLINSCAEIGPLIPNTSHSHVMFM
jgi:5'-3' exonuclease